MTPARGRAGMRRQVGFTLVELMIVVAIIGVLAVVAGTAFKRFGASGRRAEAMSMIGEFKSKEEAYKAEYNTYVSTDSVEGNLTPALGSCTGQTEPCAKALLARNLWTAAPMLWWGNLGINPGRNQLYCGYVAIAGNANVWTGTAGVASTAGTNGQKAFGNTPPTQPWFYIEAQCDNNAPDTRNSTYIATSTNSALITIDEGF